MDDKLKKYKLIADFMAISVSEYMEKALIVTPLCIDSDIEFFVPDVDMNVLYSVYQKITKFMSSREYSGINIIVRKHLFSIYRNMNLSISNGLEIQIIFDHVVDWITMYNTL